MYYPNALGPKGSEWSYLIPLASLTVLAAYYVAPFCACNGMDFMKKLELGEKMPHILVQGHLIGRY